MNEKGLWTPVIALIFVLCLPEGGMAAGLRIEPSVVVLTGPEASQRLLILRSANGDVIGDWTSKARFESCDPTIARIDAAGTLRAVSDGTATIRVLVDGSPPAEAKVQVRGTRQSFI